MLRNGISLADECSISLILFLGSSVASTCSRSERLLLVSSPLSPIDCCPCMISNPGSGELLSAVTNFCGAELVRDLNAYIALSSIRRLWSCGGELCEDDSVCGESVRHGI